MYDHAAWRWNINKPRIRNGNLHEKTHFCPRWATFSAAQPDVLSPIWLYRTRIFIFIFGVEVFGSIDNDTRLRMAYCHLRCLILLRFICPNGASVQMNPKFPFELQSIFFDTIKLCARNRKIGCLNWTVLPELKQSQVIYRPTGTSTIHQSTQMNYGTMHCIRIETDQPETDRERQRNHKYKNTKDT